MARACRIPRWSAVLALSGVLVMADSAAAQLPNITPPSLPGTGGSANRSRRNYSRMTSQLRQQLVAQLQAQHKTAQQALPELQAQVTKLQGLVESATSHAESLRESVQSTQQEVNNAVRQLEAAEERVIAAQAEGSPYRLKLSELTSERTAMDARMRELCSLPPPPNDGTDPEKHRTQDLLKLTPEQRSRLKQDPLYSQHAERANQLSRELEQLKQSLLEADAEWKSARDARISASERHRQSHEELRQASGEGIRARRELEAARERMQQTQAALAELEWELRQLGARPTN